MKYVKTFESFNYNPVNEGMFGDAINWVKNAWEKAKAWWSNWKDERKKKAAQAILTALEKNKDNPEVQKKLAEIKAAEEKLNPEEKKQLESLKDEKKIEELGKALEGSPELAKPLKESLFYLHASGKLNEGIELNEALILEGLKETVGKALYAIGLSVGVVAVIIMMIGLCTMTGGGFIVAAAPLVGGMSAGTFCAVMCGVIGAGGAVAVTGAKMTD